QRKLRSWNVAKESIPAYFVSFVDGDERTIILRREDGSIIVTKLDARDRAQFEASSALSIAVKEYRERNAKQAEVAAEKKKQNENLPDHHEEKNFVWRDASSHAKFGTLVSINNSARREATIRLVT